MRANSYAKNAFQKRLRKRLRARCFNTPPQTIASAAIQPIPMVARDLNKRLVLPFATVALVDHAHASRPLTTSLNPDVLVDRELPFRILLVDAVPERQGVVEFQPDGVPTVLVLQRFDFAERRLEPGGGPGG